MNITSFPTATLDFQSGTNETIIIGGRDKFPILKDAFHGIKQIGIIGWGSQGPAQAQNIRDSLREIGSDIKVVVGLRDGSSSIAAAKEAGFSADDGTLGEMFSVIHASDLVILLISDAAQTELCEQIFDAMRPGTTLGLSHGFLEGFLSSKDDSFPSNINVVMVAPKGMGPSVRKLYLQGLDSGGSGINSSYAVHQDVDGNAERFALGWAVAIGSPVVFKTTIQQEWCSDIFGERAILLGGLWALSEALYDRNRANQSERDAFINSVMAITSFISPEISKLGLKGFYETHIKGKFDRSFNDGYRFSYDPFSQVMVDIHCAVSSGEEIRDVIQATAALHENPMPSIEQEPMWQVGERVRAEVDGVTQMNASIAFAAGAFIAGTMAQFRLLKSNGHRVSEIVNESLVEATDSLIPFMDARGVAFMVDNCSTTARLGTRKWGPVFKQALADAYRAKRPTLNTSWLDEPIHADVAKCYEHKPKVAIAVV